MKGTSFQNGVEFKVIIDGESWSQGTPLSGTIEAVVRNAGAKTPTLKVILADAEDKNVKAKKPDAFDVLETLSFEKSPSKWKFELPITARVSDKYGALYLLYGSEQDDLNLMGQLKLNIIPHQHIQDLLDVLKIHFRFVPKSVCAGKKNTVEAKFDAPDGKEWASLEYLMATLSLTENDTLEASFQFCRKHIDATAGSMAAKTVKKNIDREFPFSDFVHDFNRRLDKEAVTAAIEQVIEEYRSTGWLQ